MTDGIHTFMDCPDREPGFCVFELVRIRIGKSGGRNIFYDGIERGYEDVMSIIIDGVGETCQ